MLTPNEIQSVLSIIERQTAVFIGLNLGKKFLSDSEQKMLVKAGINVPELYATTNDPIFLNYQLGLLSEVIGENRTKALTYPKLLDMVKRGEYIKLNERELAVLDSVKRQTLSDIRTFQGNIFKDFNGVVNQVEAGLKPQEEFIREEIMEGLKRRDSLRQIVRDLHKKTGDWSRDFSRIVQYVSHKALSEGRASMIRRKGDSNVKVYVQVYEGACKHCVQKYLTNGQGSAPKIFTLSELEGNGTNIGKKVAAWLPTIPPLHPYCRCNVHEYEGGEWNGSKFEITEYQPKIDRKKIKVTIGGVDYMV